MTAEYSFIDVAQGFSFETYSLLSLEGKMHLGRMALAANKEALDKMFSEQGIDWVVIAGTVAAKSGEREKGPDADEIEAIGRQHGKPPFYLSKEVRLSAGMQIRTSGYAGSAADVGKNI